jgi:hypothetical protein
MHFILRQTQAVLLNLDAFHSAPDATVSTAKASVLKQINEI